MPSRRLRSSVLPESPGISPARNVGRKMNRNRARAKPRNTARPIIYFWAFSLPSLSSSQRSSLDGSSCSSSGSRPAE